MVGTVRRRLSVDERRDQLTLAAMEELAERGYAELSLEGSPVGKDHRPT